MNIKELVEKYESDRDNCLKSGYNETQVRNDFIDPLLKCFGWDVDNTKGKTHFLRDVIQEEYIEVEDSKTKKNPDYTLRVNGTRKLFVEVKKPSVNINNSSKAAFQTRRYGWNANLGISILTNFENLIIYDCRVKPNSTDNEHVARVKVFHYSEYESAFKELNQIISFDSAHSGALDNLFSTYERRGETFDDYFLSQIEDWRQRLAISAVNNNEDLESQDINFLIQRLLNRIIFLRICEDRTIEKFETLKSISDYDELKALFEQSDRKFNSGLFDFIEDTLSQTINIDAETLISVFNELYYPLSPYDFSVVDPAILSQIYERFLGSRVIIDDERQLSIVMEPEVSASNGVVPTPKLIVEQIIKDTLTPLVSEKTFKELKNLKVADICCGSGTFLISAYDFLLEKYLVTISNEKIDDKDIVYLTEDSTYVLTLKGKRHILESNIFGIDINPYAKEVSEFSLLLKLLEGENEATVNDYLNQFTDKLLPNLSKNIKCGNSLVDSKFYEFKPETVDDDDILFRINPFDWETEYPFLNETHGFDAIIGNPPYVRIQNLVKYSPEEVLYYQSAMSGFDVGKNDTIDKYYVFIQRAITLLNNSGYLGYIIPHKFFLIKGGRALRNYIKANCNISKITHFGVSQVFPGKSTYTAIIVLKVGQQEKFSFKRIKSISAKTLENESNSVEYKNENYNSEPWVFLTPETEQVFNKLRSQQTKPLKELAEVCVGLQTSNDDIYILKPDRETESTFIFTKQGKTWEIEKNICLPAIYKASFGLNDTINENAQIIFPYDIIDNKAVLISENRLVEEFPHCNNYLQSNIDKLLERKIQGKKIKQHYAESKKKNEESKVKWYQFGRSQSLAKFHNTEKLIWSVLATEPPYAIDKNNLQFTGGGNGPYYGLINNSDYSLYYFLGILSHPLIENMVKSGASEFRGSYYSHGKQFIENLPIRTIDMSVDSGREIYLQIIKIVKNQVSTKEKIKSASYGTKRNVLQRKIDTLQNQLILLINKLYGISNDEFNAVMQDEMFTKSSTAE